MKRVNQSLIFRTKKRFKFLDQQKAYQVEVFLFLPNYCFSFFLKRKMLICQRKRRNRNGRQNYDDKPYRKKELKEITNGQKLEARFCLDSNQTNFIPKAFQRKFLSYTRIYFRDYTRNNLRFGKSIFQAFETSIIIKTTLTRNQQRK